MGETDIRVIKTLETIDESFLMCLKTIEFRHLTVKNITESARINRTTFYKYYLDKYDLRDKYVDKIVNDFVENLDTSFIDLALLSMESYFDELKECLESFLVHKNIYLILWNAKLQDRNVFEEMISGGKLKLDVQIRENAKISNTKKRCSGLYTSLFLGNMMSSVRWWFEDGDFLTIDEFTSLMIQHMGIGIFPTLKGK